MNKVNEWDIIFDIAEKLRDPVQVKSLVTRESNRNPAMPQYSPWGDISLAHGYPSMVLLYHELHQRFPDQNWDRVRHEYIRKTVESIEQNGVRNLSLFSGLAGVCYAVSVVSQGSRHYQQLLQKLDEILLACLPDCYFLPLEKDISQGVPSSIFLYDLIQGIVGVGVYLLSRMHDARLFSTLVTLIELLIRRALPINVNGYEVAGWYLPFEHQFIEQDKKNYPQGNFNLGLSHGMTGILSFLSLASLAGIDLKGQKEAIECLRSWLQDKAIRRNGILMWPERVTWASEIFGASDFGFMQRMGWCYGKPGILRTLYLAGIAEDDFLLINEAHNRFKEIFRVSEEEWNLPGPMFCHGLLGLYVTTLRMAQDTQDEELILESSRLKAKILDFYEPYSPFGFRDVEPKSLDRESIHQEHVHIDKAGLLDGSVGIALALLEAASPMKRRWDAPFLITPIGEVACNQLTV